MRPRPPGPAGVPFLVSDFAKVTVGEVDFYLSHTVAPPRLRRGRVLDPRRVLPEDLRHFDDPDRDDPARGLMDTDVPQALEAEQLPDRIATILYQPEKYPQLKRETEVVEATPEKPKEAHAAEAGSPEEKSPLRRRRSSSSSVHPHDVPKPVPKEMNVAGEQCESR